MTPNALLSALEAQATAREMEHRYGPQSERSVTHVVDDALFLGAPRLRLLVVCAYAPFFEQMCQYGRMEVCEGLSAKPYLTYGALWCGVLQPIRITREQALEVLEAGELPERLRPVVPAEDEWDVAAFIANEAKQPYVGVNRAGRVGL